jgi:outer membrane protein assembly factor BamB
MLTQEIEAQFPRSIRVPEPPVPALGPVSVPFRLSNPTANVLWVRLSTRPFYFKVHPSVVSLRPLQGETVTAEIDPAQVTRENHGSIVIVAAWSLLETDATTGRASTRNGEYAIGVEIAPPRRSFACPDPGCAQPVLAGDRACRHCGLLLQFCPQCELPAPWTSTVCLGAGRHRLRQEPEWPMAGGNASRSGAIKQMVQLQASLAWKYAPAPPKPASIIEWSSPAIAYGTVFLAGAVPGQWSRLVALDLRTGAEIWQIPLPEEDAVYPYRGGPAVARGSVYAATFNGYVIAVDAARGKRRWAARVPHQIYGGCLAAGNALFVGTVHPSERGGHVIALWPEDGETVWSVELEGRVDTPLAARQGYVYACADDGHVYGIAAPDGQIAWRQEAGSQFDGGPAVDEGLVACGTAEGGLLALDATSGEIRWRESLPGPVEASPAIHGGRIYCGCADGSLHAFTTAGKRLGTVSVGAQIRAAPLPTGNGALLGAEDGTLYFSDAIRKVSPLYQTEPGTRLSCPLAASGGRIIMSATNGTVYAVDVGVE